MMPVAGQISAWPFFDDGVTTSGLMYIGSFTTLSMNQCTFIFGKASIFNGFSVLYSNILDTGSLVSLTLSTPMAEQGGRTCAVQGL